MINQFDQEIFSNMYFLKDDYAKIDFLGILNLLKEFYPSFSYCRDNIFDKSLNQFDLSEIIFDQKKFNQNSYLDICFNIPIYIQNDREIVNFLTNEKGISITFEKDDRFGTVIIFNIYPNVFVNYNYMYNDLTLKWERKKTDR